MCHSQRLGLIVLALSAVAAVAVFAAPPVEEPDPAPPDDAYTARLAEVDGRLEIKRGLIADLADGRRKLADVTARFAALDAGRPEVESAADCYPGATAGERYCRLVINHVDAALQDDRRQPAVLDRLNRELAAAVTAGGRLPSAGPFPDAGARTVGHESPAGGR
jgi:predicted secreted protein